MLTIDYSALDRVLGPHVAERFGLATEEHFSGDLAAPPAVLAMAIEQAEASGQSVAEAMTILLDSAVGGVSL